MCVCECVHAWRRAHFDGKQMTQTHRPTARGETGGDGGWGTGAWAG